MEMIYENRKVVFIAVDSSDSSVEHNAKKRNRDECAADKISRMRSHTTVKEEDVSSDPTASTCLSLADCS